MTDKIKLLEEWRDWYWRLMLKALSLGNTTMASYAKHRADGINDAVDFLKRKEVYPQQDRFKEFKHYKYGEWPE